MVSFIRRVHWYFKLAWYFALRQVSKVLKPVKECFGRSKKSKGERAPLLPQHVNQLLQHRERREPGDSDQAQQS